MRKMDEMEMHIILKAMRVSYAYTVIFLAIWMFYDWIQYGVHGLPFFLLITQNIVLLGTNLFLQWRMGKNEK